MKHTFLTAVFTLSVVSSVIAQGGSKVDYERATSLAKRTENKVFRDRVNAHWLPDNKSFWYKVQTGEKSYEFVLVDAESGKKKAAPNKAALGLPPTRPFRALR